MSNIERSKLIALKLASLPESDFNWIYARLNQEVKDKLVPLVNEVRAIGISLSATEIGDLFEKHALSKEGHKDKENLFYSKMIDHAAYQNIEEVFKNEPPYLLFALSGIHDWHWKAGAGYKSFATSKVKKGERSELKPLLAKSMIAFLESLLQDNSTTHSLFANTNSGSLSRLGVMLKRAPIIKRFFDGKYH